MTLTRKSTPPLLKSVLLLLTLSLGLSALATPVNDEKNEDNVPDFSSVIRPILSRHCLPCHGPDGNTRKADLRLDIHELALDVLDPSSPGAGEFSRRILSSDQDDQMPPPDFIESLDKEERETLIRWVNAGAPWEEHWSFEPLTHPTWPSSSSDSGIDFFIHEKLKQQGLSPSESAMPETLARRSSLDITGLPPEPERVDAFLLEYASHPNEAWAKWIDDLLSSPAYGERWASLWLDLSRYADTKGYEQDGHRNIWPWRDWLIRSLNSDMPFDRFTQEQLAGDLLSDATDQTRIATAFHRNTLTNDEGGTQDEEFRVAAVVDRVNTTMEVWMGLTAACAQCHDHKYDPISQKEYYQLYDVFNQTQDADRNDEFPTLPVLKDDDEFEFVKTGELLSQQLQTLSEEKLQIPDPIKQESLPDPATAEVMIDLAYSGVTLPLATETIDQTVTPWIWSLAPVGSPEGLTRIIRQKAPPQQTRQVFFDQSLIPISVRNGDTLSIQVKILESPQTLMLQVHSADETAWEHRAFWGEDLFTWGISGTPSRWQIGDSTNLEVTGEWLHLEIPISTIAITPDKKITGVALSQIGGLVEWGGVRLRGIREEAPRPLSNFDDFLNLYPQFQSQLLPAEIRSLIEQNPELGSDSYQNLFDWWKSDVSLYGRMILFSRKQEIAQTRKLLESIQSRAVSVPILASLSAEMKRETRLLQRGSYLQPGEIVTGNVPEFLHSPSSDTPMNRLELAKWLVHPDNPLTARVQVNRIWEQLFGKGLVRTVEDLGTQGELPSHPELLDHLAVTWQESDQWSFKALIRRIMLSDTYRQSSRQTPEHLRTDPDNVWLARAPRTRLTAEMIRDQALAVGGLLSRKLYGPPVYPPQPDGVWQVVYNGSNWPTSVGENRVRRSLYTYWRRTAPYPAMLIFDSPDRQVCQSRRIRTNTPLQALVTLNDPVYIEAAAGLAKLALSENDTVLDAVTFAFRRALSRKPESAELETLMSLVSQQIDHFSESPENAQALIEGANWDISTEQDPLEAAALIILANVILNLDEFLVRG